MWNWLRRLFRRESPAPGLPPVRGTVKRIVRDRGFGFIRGADGKEIFFHRSALVGTDLRSLSEGQTVEYVPEEGPKGMRASRVRVIRGRDGNGAPEEGRRRARGGREGGGRRKGGEG
jgi:CspA family cold shock protein